MRVLKFAVKSEMGAEMRGQIRWGTCVRGNDLAGNAGVVVLLDSRVKCDLRMEL